MKSVQTSSENMEDLDQTDSWGSSGEFGQNKLGCFQVYHQQAGQVHRHLHVQHQVQTATHQAAAAAWSPESLL